jgi:hypothetical protein
MKDKLQRITEVTKEKLGLYGKGLRVLPEPDERDYIAAPLNAGELGVFKDLYNTFVLDQERTKHCTAYSGALCLTIQVIAKKRNQSIGFNPKDQWKNQLQYPGKADEKLGDFIESAPKAIKFFGLDWGGKTYKINKYEFVPKTQWKEYLSKGFPIMTGAPCASTFTDNKYYWNPISQVKAKWAHAFLVVGYDDRAEHFLCQNSWGRWGEKKTGRFYVRYEDAPQLFRGWIMHLDE